MEKTLISSIAKILTLVGALNWGLIGIGDFTGYDLDVVDIILGGLPTVESVVYVLMGLSAVYLLLPGRGLQS